MRTIVVGCNHRTAPIELRERLAFDDTSCLAALSAVGLRYPCCETVILSTCNRTELYVARPNHGRPRIQEAIAVLADVRGVPLHEISQALYHFVDSQESHRFSGRRKWPSIWPSDRERWARP